MGSVHTNKRGSIMSEGTENSGILKEKYVFTFCKARVVFWLHSLVYSGLTHSSVLGDHS